MKIKQLEKSAIQAVRILRESKLKNGLPFMINSENLPSDQCYLEYPNGSITLVSLSRKSSDFEIIVEYSRDSEESRQIKKKYNLV
jgi:hypothetical protein